MFVKLYYLQFGSISTASRDRFVDIYVPGLEMDQIQKMSIMKRDIPVTIGLNDSSAH